MLVLDGNFEFVLNVDLRLISNNQESYCPKKYLQLDYNLISTPYYFGLFQLLTFQKTYFWLRNLNSDWLRFNQFKQEWWNVPDSSLLKNWWWRLLAVPDDKCLWRSQIKVLLTWPTFYTGSHLCPKCVIKLRSSFCLNVSGKSDRNTWWTHHVHV